MYISCIYSVKNKTGDSILQKVIQWDRLLHVIFVRGYNLKISNIRHTQNQNLNDSRLIMQLPLPNALKPCVKSRMKM